MTSSGLFSHTGFNSLGAKENERAFFRSTTYHDQLFDFMHEVLGVPLLLLASSDN